MLRLRRVHIHKYRGVLPGEELRFGPEAVFVLGRNGAGKTTFLELLTRLVACDVSHFVKEGGAVDVEWEMVEDDPVDNPYGGLVLSLRYVQVVVTSPAPARISDPSSSPPITWNLTGQLRGSHTAVVLSAGSDDSETAPDIEDEHHKEYAFPTLHFVLNSNKGLSYSNLEDGTSGSVDIPDRIDIERSALHGVASYLGTGAESSVAQEVVDEFWLTALIRIIGFPKMAIIARFDEALETFRSIVGGPGPQVVIPLAEARVGAKGDLVAKFFGATFIPTELLPDVFRTEPTPLTNQTYRPDSLPENSRFLAPVFEAFGALDVELRPRLVEEDEQGRGLWRTFDIFVRWPGGLKQRHDHLSFGQKRMLAFLWYQAATFGVPVFTDELTNGLHSAWARQITDLLAGRQAFHAVQNPLMLDMAGLGAEEE
ncbi:hypothetical protein L6R46_18765, partial [Myxococcota bacterium]|nr:hypothetical protein [Myxococcota bacterium]